LRCKPLSQAEPQNVRIKLPEDAKRKDDGKMVGPAFGEPVAGLGSNDADV